MGLGLGLELELWLREGLWWGCSWGRGWVGD